VAKFLYQIGMGAARRAWVVVTAWVLVLGFSAAAMLGFAGKLTTSMTIDGLKAQQVIDQLKVSFPAASQGSGTVVFHTRDGKAFTATQRSAITAALTKVTDVPFVAAVVDPFATEAMITTKRQQVEGGLAQLAGATAKLHEAQTKLDASRAQLAAAPGQSSAAMAQLDAAQAQIDASRNALATNSTTLKLGQRLLAVSAGFSTVSKDGATALGTIQFKTPLNEVDATTFAAVTDTLAQANIAGVELQYSAELSPKVDSLLGAGEITGLVVAVIVLLVMLGTLIGAGLPLLSAVMGVGVSASIAMALSSKIEMTTTTPVLGVMLGLAVGIDYTLFILNRHRRQLKAGVELRESIGLANGTSGSAVLFAGMTVVIALVALNLTGIGFLGLMGSVGAGAIVVAVLVALTLTPAFLSLAGTHVLSKRERATFAAEIDHSAAAEPRNAQQPIWANRHPWVAILLAVLTVSTLALPAASLRLGLPDGSSDAISSTQYKAYKLTSQAFGAGSNGPVLAIVSLPEKLDATAELRTQAVIAERIVALKNVAAVIPAAVSIDHRSLMFQVMPTTGPASVETTDLVYAIRGLESGIATDFHATLGVTGLAAMNIDVSKKLSDVLPTYLATVLLLSLLLLIAVFRSIAVPLLASVGFLATIMATFGAVVAVFQWGWFGAVFGVHDPGPVLSFLPTILIGVLFGLAMDYQLFITSGIREAHIHGKSSRESINYGVHLSRAVVIAAAIIMVFVFGGFAFSHMAMIRPMGFGLAFGVLVDAFIVRLMLVPAVMTILGEKAWWIPGWLDRVLPDVDIEGAALEREHLH
jgi:RND superfamily putative drug exporter